MNDKPTDPRTQVLLSLLPPGAVFRHCYSDDSLWRPESRGYVNERDPLRAGLYQPDGYYAPWAPPATVECSECDGIGECEVANGERAERCEHCGGLGYVGNPGGRSNDHSFTIDAADYLRKYTVQDGTALALLIDEVLQLRACVQQAEQRAAELDDEVTRQLRRAVEGRPIALTDTEARRLYGIVPSEPPAKRDVGRVVIVSPVIDDNDATDYLTQRLYNAGVWHITWISDAAKAAERAQEVGAVVLTVTAEDVRGEFVTHVREDGLRVSLAEWCASVNPGRHVSDCEDDE